MDDTLSKFLVLQNGSDIRGVALPGADGEEVNLTVDIARRIGYSFALWLADSYKIAANELTIGIGRDPRNSGQELKKAVCSGLHSAGCTTFDFGLATTPSMFMSTRVTGYRYEGAIMITASHLPWNRNGFKFFNQSGGLDNEDIRNILTTAALSDISTESFVCDANVIDFKYVYAGLLTNLVTEKTNREKPLDNFHIIIDAGNGSGGFYESLVLQRLGANTEGSLYTMPDGSFPNHVPNPEDPEALTDLCNAVVEKGADMGIIFDTDVDRVAVIDNKGRPVNRNRFIALCAAIILEDYPGTTIVTDSITSTGLKRFIENDLKGRHHRFKRGYRNVINEAKRLNREGIESHLAIETSGHAALRDNYWLDDGAYLVTLILAKVSQLGRERSIFSLIENLIEPVEEKEFRIPIGGEDFSHLAERVLKALQVFSGTVEGWTPEIENHEGFRVNCDSDSGDGWFLVRVSLHDPILPVNIESDSPGGVKIMAQVLYHFLKRFDNLELSSLEAFFKSE